tara:strand:- start:27395 stop:27892 length:498 start_codon:yes stop_codon:yes gene_type:complete
MIKAIEKNLQRGIQLLNLISDDDYSNSSIPPYFSSVGCHIRHVLDMFSCVLKGKKSGIVDFTYRERNEAIELKCEVGIDYFHVIINKLNLISKEELASEILVTDDLGLGKITSKSTLGAILMQTQSHAIHHYASIANIIYQQGIELPDSDFGFNPTTPNKNLRGS